MGTGDVVADDLLYVDRQDDGTGSLARHRKKSFFAYRDIISSNGACL